ncbi:LCI fold-containing protein [Bacillus halotolerans]|uniref:LCI fold-containing protein n=1 Tax=Bacillus halotolerans TaxID=260554 RepID=UPI0003A687A4|nr:LCI fold-containing protein [Bacillus halotolerans]UYO33815.1 antimicrobial peptide LCI [Bacillus halotolerans]
MSYKKALTGVALSVGLIVSASPAFAASTSPDQVVANVASDDFKAQAITWDLPSTTGIFANTFEQDGIRWYLKSITKVSEGYWIGHYEGVRI